MKKKSSRLPEEMGPWHRRLHIPCYQLQEAAHYAQSASRTVASWHRKVSKGPRLKRLELSYLQLLEVAVVAKFRQAGIRLKNILKANDYLRKTFNEEYPFVEYRFKTNGKELLMNYGQINKKSGYDKLLNLNTGGQFEWKGIVGSFLQSFEYDENSGLAVRWHVKGIESPIIIDPQVSFGAPSVSGVPTWVLKSRWETGESLEDIASDFNLENSSVAEALRFENIQPDPMRKSFCASN